MSQYAQVLKRCSLSDGKQVHSHLRQLGCDQNTFLGNLLVQMYATFGCLEEAITVFDRIHEKNAFSWNIIISSYIRNGCLEQARISFLKMPQRDVVSWNSFISACAQNGQNHEALELFQAMDVLPDRITYISCINACAGLANLEMGKAIHSRVLYCGFQSDIVVASALVSMYGRCGSLQAARKLFDGMVVRNVVTWTSMVAAHAQNDDWQEALLLLTRMSKRNIVSWNVVIAVCAQNGQMQRAKHMFDQMPERDIVSWNAMISGYAQNGYGRESLQLYQEMNINPDRITYVSVLDACASLLDLQEGKAVHMQAASFGLEEEIGNCLINMYGKCMCLDAAKKAFDKLREKSALSWNTMLAVYGRNKNLQGAVRIFHAMSKRGIVSWNAMMTAYSQNEEHCKALCMFRMMDLEGIQLNEISFISVVHSCSVADCKVLCAELAESVGHINFVVGTCFLNLYAKRGKVEDAKCVFDNLSTRSMVTWNSLVTAFAHHGHVEKANVLLQEMLQEGIQPDSTMFVLLLVACSHTGFLRTAHSCFISMQADYSQLPSFDHYICMIDILCRSGRLAEAQELISNMPFEPDVDVWTTILSACNTQSDMERGVQVAHHVFRMNSIDSKDLAPVVLLSNILNLS